VFFLRNTNSAGYADASFSFGSGGFSAMPLVGMWYGSNSSAASVSQQSLESSAHRDDWGRFYAAAQQMAGSVGLDRIADAVPDSVRDGLFGELATDHNGPFDRDDLMDRLHDHLGSLLGEPVNPTMLDHLPKDRGESLQSPANGVVTDSLTFDMSLEQASLDQIFDWIAEARV
jgi:hypothetical protein